MRKATGAWSCSARGSIQIDTASIGTSTIPLRRRIEVVAAQGIAPSAISVVAPTLPTSAIDRCPRVCYRAASPGANLFETCCAPINLGAHSLNSNRCTVCAGRRYSKQQGIIRTTLFMGRRINSAALLQECATAHESLAMADLEGRLVDTLDLLCGGTAAAARDARRVARSRFSKARPGP